MLFIAPSNVYNVAVELVYKQGAEPNGKGQPKTSWHLDRVSTEDQAKGESPEHHEKRARFYAESKSWQVKLKATSGKSVMGYTETKRMPQDILVLLTSIPHILKCNSTFNSTLFRLWPSFCFRGQ